MSYYPTLAEDVARAKEILERGHDAIAQRLAADEFSDADRDRLRADIASGTIYGADVFAAYQLLRSFVEAIEAVDPKVCELAIRAQRLADGRKP